MGCLPPCIPPQARGGSNELPSFPSSRFPGASLTHHAPTCRPSGAKGRIESPVADMSAIVGAGFPRPMGWRIQPLRIPPSRFPVPYPANPSIPGEASGFRQPPHCTPLECCCWTNRRSIDITLRWSEKQSCFPAPLVRGEPLSSLLLTPTLHSAGVLLLDQSPFYRHVAPLGLKTEAPSFRVIL